MTKLAKAPNVELREVEWRVDGKPVQRQDGSTAARFVPYVNASTVSERLDEWVGPADWKDRYEGGMVAGKEVMWCHLSIRTEDGWVTKTDLGIPTNFEGQKGAVSDAFKRAACLKWGVARNVYSLPTLWAPCRVDNKGNAWPNDKTVPSILAQLEKAGYEADGARVQVESEVSAGSASAEPNATPVAPRPEVSPNSWGEEEKGESPASEASGSPTSSWDDLIQRYGREQVWEIAKQTARDLKDGLVPIKDSMLEKCSPRVFAATAEILAQNGSRQPSGATR